VKFELQAKPSKLAETKLC